MLELRDGGCYPKAVMGVNVGLASVDCVIAILAFCQLMRIHSRNSEAGCTRQKVFHLMIGSSNLGYFVYFVLNLVAACKGWSCWSHSCGFIVMALPEILFVAAFLLLLSFWVDLCHQSNEDDEDEESPREVLLDKRNKADPTANGSRNCCSFRSIRVGSRQKVVILVTALVFAIMAASSVLIWIGMGKNPIDSAVVAQVYVDLIAIAVILLGGALACYGLMLFLKMRRVRSERASSEAWKVAGLAVVSVVCFTLSAVVALATNIPVCSSCRFSYMFSYIHMSDKRVSEANGVSFLQLFYHWSERQIDSAYTSLLLVLYFFLGSSVPSAFVLYVMRELPPPIWTNMQQETRTIAFISDGAVSSHPQQRWTAAATSLQNQTSRASPI